MRKLLVSGCSLSSGFGFTDTNIERSWPNQLAERIDATLTNVAVPGYDNPGIFISAIEQLTQQDFDICLIQLSSIDRIVLSPNWNGRKLTTNLNMSNGFLSKKQYQSFYKSFLLLNQHAEHWNKLLKIIHSVQHLNKQGKYVRFVNGLLDWDQELFADPCKSKFLDRLIDIDNICDEDIKKLRTLVYNQARLINLDFFINPFNNFRKIRIDSISSDDTHPGVKSHDLYTDLIFNYLTRDKINA
jgi:hypothetical protein